MIKVLIERQVSDDQGTFGRLSVGDWSCFTGELPWRDNARGMSCIPPGKYRASMVYVPKFKRFCYLVLPTAPRVGILMHAATWMGDTQKGYKTHLQGCIALGERLGVIEGQKALLLSRPAMSRFEDLTARQPIELEIHDA